MQFPVSALPQAGAGGQKGSGLMTTANRAATLESLKGLWYKKGTCLWLPGMSQQHMKFLCAFCNLHKGTFLKCLVFQLQSAFKIRCSQGVDILHGLSVHVVLG